MRKVFRPISATCVALGAALAFGVLAARPAAALDLLGAYVGGAVGQARVEAGGFTNPLPSSVPSLHSLDKNHSAFQVTLGVRPLPVIGAEIDYFDLGRASGGLGSSQSLPIGYLSTADVHMTGEAAFAVLYLPIPVVDVYAKVGLARITATGTATVHLTGAVLCPISAPNCSFSTPYRETSTSGAAGIGAELKLGSWAVRAEYERFSAAGEHPSLISVGLIWKFL